MRTLQDPDLNVRRVALVAFNSAAHNKPSLVRDLLDSVLPQLYSETKVRVSVALSVDSLLTGMHKLLITHNFPTSGGVTFPNYKCIFICSGIYSYPFVLLAVLHSVHTKLFTCCILCNYCIVTNKSCFIGIHLCCVKHTQRSSS
jgi:hypothetical protein